MLSTLSPKGSQKDTNQKKAVVSLHQESSATHKEQTHNIDVMKMDEGTKFMGSHAMSGTLATVTELNARYVGSVSCTSFTGHGATQKVSTSEKCNHEKLLNCKTSITIHCHWHCVFLGFDD